MESFGGGGAGGGGGGQGGREEWRHLLALAVVVIIRGRWNRDANKRPTTARSHPSPQLAPEITSTLKVNNNRSGNVAPPRLIYE